MSDTWFFLSYARNDRENDKQNCISRFYDDLDAGVRRLKNIREGAAGFFDGQSIQQGDDWSNALGNSLNNCRVLLCMYSTAYFSSQYCGKEWQVFNTRLESAYPKSHPPLILPILLDAPEFIKPLPKAVSKIQYMDDDYPETYRNEGLIYLMVRNNQRDIYQDFLQACVEKLIKAANAYPLAALDNLPEFNKISSAFHTPPASSGLARKAPVNVGPRYAEFIYVAAQRAEIEQLPVRPISERYGDEGELDWKPYLPPDETEKAREIWSYAQDVANKEDFRYQSTPLEGDLVEHITEAQRNNRIVVIVVDTWTLCLEKYREIMKAYDRVIFWNSVVLITWNKDSSQESRRDQLTNAVQMAFMTKSILKDERFFIDNINSPNQLESVLSIALQRLKMQIIEAIEFNRKIESDMVILQPTLSAPGGARE